MSLPRGARRGPSVWLASLTLLVASFALLAPASAHAGIEPVRLGLLPVGQPGSFFDLVMAPGETRTLKVDISNDGSAAIEARTYAADVYTIIDGGFGARLRAEAQSATTRWLAYPAATLQLAVGVHVQRALTLAVPAGASSGEYATSIVLEDDQPLIDGVAMGVGQVLRQAVAVVVTVPGLRSPGLAVGGATHKVVAGTSTVSVALQNDGNVRLRPVVGFDLVDSSGTEVSHATIQMDTFYAQTSTFVEFPLAHLLVPGTYTVSITLDDAVQAAHTARASIALVVESPITGAAGGSVLPGLISVTQGPDQGSLVVPAIIATVVVLVAFGVGFLIARRRSPRRGSAEIPPHDQR